MKNLAGMKWGQLTEEQKNELLIGANAIDGRTGNNMKCDGECIVDFNNAGNLSAPGRVESQNDELVILIEDEAVLYGEEN